MIDVNKVISRPIMPATGTIEINAEQFLALWDFINLFRGAQYAIDTAVNMNTIQGKMKIGLYHENGTPLTEVEEAQYYQELERLTRENVQNRMEQIKKGE